MDQLFSTFQEFGLRYEGANELISNFLREDVHKEGSMMVRIGEVNRRIYFIESGMIRHFVSKPKKDITPWILTENNIAVIPDSFFDQVPAKENMQALEKTITRSITFQEFKEIIRRHPEFGEHEKVIYRYYRELHENIRRELGGLDDYEKYLWLLENQPQVAARATNPIICSYLDIMPNMLAAIRRRMSGKK